MSYKLTLYIQNKSTSPKQTGFLINQAGLWEYNNKCTHSELHCQNTGSVGSFLAPDRLWPWIRRSFSVRGHDGHKIVLKSLKMPPINYCKGQRGQSLAWKPAKSHQSAVRVTSVSGTPLFSLSPCSLSLFSSPPFSTSVFIVRALPCFLANEGPPTKPKHIKIHEQILCRRFFDAGAFKAPGLFVESLSVQV